LLVEFIAKRFAGEPEWDRALGKIGRPSSTRGKRNAVGSAKPA
jgi:hypothetical protein